MATPTRAATTQERDDLGGGLVVPEISPTPDSQTDETLSEKLDSLSRRVTILSLLTSILALLFFVLLLYVAQLRREVKRFKGEVTRVRDGTITGGAPEGRKPAAGVPAPPTIPPRQKPAVAPARDTTPPRDVPVPTVAPSSTGKWTIVGASVIGNDHIKMKMPCQDSNRYGLIENDWGIAVVADGAGSAANSDRGARFVAEVAAFEVFHSLVSEQGWSRGKGLPTEKQWEVLARQCWVKVRDRVIDYANREDIEPRSLNCTAIAVIFSPKNILITHIGDGRAAFRDESGVWQAIMKPYKGEEANATIFVSSMRQGHEATFPIGSRIINSQVSAFTLMSDGVEKYAFEQSQMDRKETEWTDPNLPFPRFLEPLVDSIRTLKEGGASPEELITEWRRFLVSGTGVKDASDDKTIILGLFDNHRG